MVSQVQSADGRCSLEDNWTGSGAHHFRCQFESSHRPGDQLLLVQIEVQYWLRATSSAHTDTLPI